MNPYHSPSGDAYLEARAMLLYVQQSAKVLGNQKERSVKLVYIENFVC